LSPFSDHGQTYRFVGLEGTLELGGKRGGRIKVAEKLVEESAIQAQTVLRDIHVQVHKAYAELSVGEEQLKLVQSRFEIAKKIYEQIEIRSQVGDSSGLDLVRARSIFNLHQIDLERAKTNLVKSQIKLNALLAFPVNQIVQTENIKELKPNYEKLHDHPQLTQIKEDAMNNRLELALLKAKQNTQEASMSLAKRQFVADLTIAAGPSLDIGNPLGIFLVGKLTFLLLEIEIFRKQKR
jgi:cobalt-zinc-cadmium efflux system outer membrane protein